MEVNEAIQLITNNGIGIFCMIYIIVVQNKVLIKIDETLEKMNTRLTIIEEHLKTGKDK